MSWRTPVTYRQHTGAWTMPGQSERVAEHTMAGKVVVKTNLSDECVSVLARVCLCVCLCLRRAPCLCYFRRCPCMYTSLCVSASSHVIVFICVHHVTSRKQAETHMTDGIALTTKMQGSKMNCANTDFGQIAHVESFGTPQPAGVRPPVRAIAEIARCGKRPHGLERQRLPKHRAAVPFPLRIHDWHVRLASVVWGFARFPR